MAVFDVDVPLRWVDLDAQAHVNNALVVDYLQEARVGVLLRSPNAALLGHGLVVVGHQVDYLAPIEYSSDPLQVRLSIGRVRAASYLYAYELSQQGRPVAEARTEVCVYDFETQCPRKMTDAERAWFDEVAEPVEPLPTLGPFTLAEAHEYPFVVRWSDVDSYGHVNNVRFVSYVGEARVALHRLLDPDVLPTSMDADPTCTLLIARQDMRYIKRLEHRLEPYVVRTGIARVGTTSVTFAHEIVDPLDGTVYGRGAAVLVHADAAGRPTPVPQVLREAAERWAVAS